MGVRKPPTSLRSEGHGEGSAHTGLARIAASSVREWELGGVWLSSCPRAGRTRGFSRIWGLHFFRPPTEGRTLTP